MRNHATDIKKEDLIRYEEAYAADPIRQVMTCAFSKANMNDLAFDPVAARKMQFKFSVDIKTMTALNQLVQRERLLSGAFEVGQAERLEQIIQRIEFETLDGILRVGGGEDDHRSLLARERTDELRAHKVGHIDIDKYQINPLVLQELLCLDGVAELGNVLQKRHLRDVGPNLTESQRLIVNGYATYHYLHGIMSSTLYSSALDASVTSE